MANKITNTQYYSDIATAIRSKLSSADTYTPSQMAAAIESIPTGTTITDGMIVNAYDSNGFLVSVDFYGSIFWRNIFNGHTALTTLNILSNPTAIRGQAFRSCRLPQIIMPVSVTKVLDGDAFRDNSALLTVHLPGVTEIRGQYNFTGSNNIQDITIGSVGHGLTYLQNGNSFNTTKSYTTITVYTSGSNVDTFLTAIRNYATAATIVIKASEATTYGGTSYAAGDTIVTSTP